MPLFALVFVDVLGLTLVLPLLHLYGAVYGANPLQIGLIAASFPLAQLVGVPIMGALSDRFGRKPLLLISQITTCISFVMLGFAPNLQVVILSRLIDGLFGANLATAQAALSDLTDENTRTQGLGLTGAAFGLGFIFGPILSLAALEMSNSLVVPALSAAMYSFLSILFTLFFFEESLPPEKRGQTTRKINPFIILSYLFKPKVNGLLLLMFAQQLIFFGFETLLGLFILSRLGLLGDGSAIIFLIVGITLVTVQVRFIGKWARRYGEQKLIIVALTLLAFGLGFFALTPEQPHPLYVKSITEYTLQQQSPSSTEAILGELSVSLPEETNRGIFGVLWVMLAVVPLATGAGLMRPSLNSLMTKQVGQNEYGSILGVSSSFVSAANASAPLIGGLLFQTYGASMPFLIGSVVMAILAILSFLLLTEIMHF